MRYRSESRSQRGPDYDPPGQRRPSAGQRRPPAGQRRSPAGQAGRSRAPGGRARASGSRPRPRRWRHPRLAKTGYAAVTFLTVVVVLASLGAYAVYRRIFQMITSGQPWHHGQPTLRPGKVKVQVLNGSGITGLAGRTAHSLRKYGFDVTGVGNATTPASTTTVTYAGTAQADSAYTLMTALKATPAARNLLAEPTPQTGHAGPVTLILGPDFIGVNPPPAPHPGKASHRKRRKTRSSGYGSAGFVQTRNAGASICSGLPKANPNPGRPP